AGRSTSWYGFAKFILENAERMNYPLKIQSTALQSIASSDFPLPAKRPFNSRLNTEKLTKTFALVLPAWQTGAARTLTELLNK
ncbi:MAG: sugar nucleotide-binding protein, partial [Nitrosomonas sp.]